MSLASGTRVGPYDIVGPLGAGGMGEVYRARDRRLSRDVAVKLLPESFAADPERVTRFTREAHLLAAMNHPNIAHMYGVEEIERQSGPASAALIMELVEGTTLADRLAEGPLPSGEAIAIARQIAEALEYAHDHGVVHRDLKPANVKLRGDGVVKVLDFGLARAMVTGTDEPDVSASPTELLLATEAGVILGTAAYMSPEQARGRAVDRRADIWSFGVVLFEMLSGRRVFDGTSATEIIAAVIRDDPPWDALPAATPPYLRALLERCLERDVRRRLRDIGEARIVLEQPPDVPAIGAPSEIARGQTKRCVVAGDRRTASCRLDRDRGMVVTAGRAGTGEAAAVCDSAGIERRGPQPSEPDARPRSITRRPAHRHGWSRRDLAVVGSSGRVATGRRHGWRGGALLLARRQPHRVLRT